MQSVPSIHARPGSAPRELGAWQLVRLIGEGKQCRVYQARPKGNARVSAANYAVKALRSDRGFDASALETLRREALVGRTISHPRLVPILSAHLALEPYFVIMPYLRGKPLDQWLSRGRRLSLPFSLWMARQVAEALRELHREGWMHADVKPSNIMVSPSGHATLIDFGLARRPGEEQSIVDRPVAGTARYIAPEMICSALRHDIRCDIYSLGATLFELLAGQPPWAGKTLAEVAQEQRQGGPRKLKMVSPRVPAAVEELVDRMLANEPLRRPQTPEELIEALTRLEIAALASR